MKLLRLIRTIKQNVLDSSKFKGDFCCLRAQVSTEVQDLRTNSFSFSFSRPSHDPKPPRVEEEVRFDEDRFCGFLAIGTLAMDPETPKFAASVADENVTRQKGDNSKLITEKIDKFLEANPEDTSSKWVERSNAEGDRIVQQGYDLFRSSVELTKRINGGVRRKKGLLTSLFKSRETVEGEYSVEKHGIKYLIKRIFEKLHGSSTKTRLDDDDNPMPNKKDLRKSVQIFRNIVYPVLSTPTRDDNKIDDRRSCDLKVPSLAEGFLGSSSISKSNKKRENWIKTDAKYLVLEL